MESKNFSGEPVAGRARLGREATTERILEAAEKLFASAPPSAVTTRAIAQEAEVNLALIHRYVGSKDAVLQAVMHRYARRFKEDVERSRNFEHGLLELVNDPKQECFFRTLAHVVLSGHPLSELVTTEGGVSALLEVVPQERSEQTKVLAMLAISWGWRLFGEFLLLCAGSRDDPSAVGQDVLEHLLGSLRVSGKDAGRA